MQYNHYSTISSSTYVIYIKKDFSMFYKGNGSGLLTSSVAADTIATKKGSSSGIKVKQKTPNNGRDRVWVKFNILFVVGVLFFSVLLFLHVLTWLDQQPLYTLNTGIIDNSLFGWFGNKIWEFLYSLNGMFG